MSRRTQFIGLLGLVIFVFGLIVWGLVANDEYFLIPAHIIVGLVLIVIFVASGGVANLSSVAAKRAAGFGAGVFFYSLIFFGLVSLVNYYFSKNDFLHYDSTKEKIYTLSSQSLAVLDALKTPVIARAFYIGGKIEPDVEALLKRFAKASDKFRWSVIDPERRPQEMEKYGISQTATIHFSFDTADSQREAKISRDIGEEEVVNALLKLSRGGEKKVYYLVGHGEADMAGTGEAGFLFIKEAIQGENLLIEPFTFSGTDKVPEDAAAFMVLAPKRALLATEKQTIAKYIENGGNAIFATEPKTTSDIAELTKSLGITVGNDIVVDQIMQIFAGPGLGIQPLVSNYGIHPITEDFGQSTVFSTVSSVLKSAESPAEGKVTELALTSANGWAERNLEKIYGDKPTATFEQEDLKGPVPIAAAFEGKLKSDGKDSRVVVLGDIDFVSNENLRKMYNSDFFLNALNWVVGQDRVVKIALKKIQGSKDLISQDQFNKIFIFTAILFPEFLLIIGLGIWWSRRALV